MRDCLTSPTSPICILRLKPAVLKRMMERALSKAPEANTAFLQITGMRVVYDSHKPQPRVESIYVRGKALNFADAQTTITVAMPRELALGGSGYLRVFPSEDINGITPTGHTIIEAIKREFSAHGNKISPAVDGRLKDTAK
jgi:2',3'-cyclic-nucleotide 2'-phosphodiesterase/3'-nucleotidase/5'-nucleotidase